MLEKKQKLIQRQQEHGKLQRAAIEFRGIKKSYVKDFRQSTIEQMEQIDSCLAQKEIMLSLS